MDELLEAIAPTQAALQRLWPGLVLELHDEIDSSNSELVRRARDGRTGAVLLVARRQTAGRGRLGRSWTTEGPQQALTFSLGLPLALRDWSGLSLAVGVALAEALHPQVGIKWPNDLWLSERKLAGILIETAASGGMVNPGARQAVVGVGINLARPEDALATGLRTAPAALREVWPDCRAGQVLARVAPPLLAAILAFEQVGFAPFQARYAARDVLAGRELLLSDGRSGRGEGVAEDGALLVHTAAGVRRVSTSEVSVRPAA